MTRKNISNIIKNQEGYLLLESLYKTRQRFERRRDEMEKIKKINIIQEESQKSRFYQGPVNYVTGLIKKLSSYRL